MGGLMKECGCFDGPFSESDHTFVSVRCAEHEDEPGEGLPMKLGQASMAVAVHARTHRLPAMAIPKGRRRRVR